MKLTLSSLKHWVDYPHSASELAEQLTVAGLETTLHMSEFTPFKNVVIGKIIEVSAHPNADRLNICKVDCGASHSIKTIVCGAKNVRKDLKVATALVGAKLPNGLEIQSRALRGVASEGMICSLSELGLESVLPQEASQPGIWELPDTFTLGDDLWEQLGLGEPILDIQVLPNRGDCLSTLGVAREVAALNNLTYKQPLVSDIAITSNASLEVNVEHKAACPRYTGRLIQNLDPLAKTPWWILKRLWEGGIRSVNAVVDITNYVLLEWGAPLHAFDFNQLAGPITVRAAHKKETLHLLNDKTVELNEETLVIADQNGPVALAGIMGGLKSAVLPETKHIFLESAYFAPEYITARARHYGLMTDASYRFERGVDPNLCKKALEMATHLLVMIAKGEAGPITQVEAPDFLPTSLEITLQSEHIQKILGIELQPKDITQGLARLGIENKNDSQAETNSHKRYRMMPPSWRFDIKESVDLIEELARLTGYDQIPAALASFPISFQKTDQARTALSKLRHYLTAQGFYEAINYSFTSSEKQKLLDPEKEPVALENPISNELNVLRTQLFGGLLATLEHNYTHQNPACSFFECGTVFIQKDKDIIEKTHLGGVISGSLLPEQWGASKKDIDFFDVKQFVQHSLALLDKYADYTYEVATHPALHPSQSSQILKNGQPIGWLGSLHPSLYTHFDLEAPLYLFEFELQTALQDALSSFQALSRFPTMRRDIAFWVDQKVTFQAIQSIILKAAGAYLQDIRLFDVYAAKDDQKRRSLALGLIWQHPERTLTEAEVNGWQSDIIKALEKEWHIEWRSGSDKT